MDSWISRRSRLEASDSDPSFGWQNSGAPQGHEAVSAPYEEAYPPADAYPEPEARHARHRAHPPHEAERELYEQAQRWAEPQAYPEAAYYAPDQYDAQQVGYAQSEADHAHEDPRDGHASRDEYRQGAGAPDPRADEGRPGRKHARDVPVPPPPATHRRRWLIPVGALALGALLGSLMFTWGAGRSPEGGLPVAAATIPAGPADEPITFPELSSTPPDSATPPSPSATPSATPSVTPSATPSATPSVTPSARPTPTPGGATPTPTASAGPVLLGPSGRRGVENMAQRYCDQHVGGSADARSDGRWQCTRLLSSSIVDMDVACRDSYDPAAFARNSDPGDAYAWRCFR
ncbi:hypothetical protein [Micromonospora sp. WMMD812]|uniref:hypothetical protein n=1 Tax=Micromonospora sp. WMMD812 TaxID=3015152 RepID=UPI00248B5A3E|nr:hypothetical protein [Micromonospora sp. WMMD812]WBB70061.1 hypothetical protein O7603_12140 [Micromonospora sp. WMMD812]